MTSVRYSTLTRKLYPKENELRVIVVISQTHSGTMNPCEINNKAKKPCIQPTTVVESHFYKLYTKSLDSALLCIVDSVYSKHSQIHFLTDTLLTMNCSKFSSLVANAHLTSIDNTIGLFIFFSLPLCVYEKNTRIF